MIDPKLLTKENGFEDEVVVEIVDKSQRVFVGRLSHVTEWNIWLVESNFHGFTFEEVQSIRPLTGPMAIWNFAPEWAIFVEVRLGGVAWLTEIPEWWDGDSEVIRSRPWWAK